MAKRDRILLTGLTFYGNHGVNPEEQALGQRFVVDVALELDLEGAGRSDDLARTINYAHAYRVIRDVVEGAPRRLIETVAQEVAIGLLSSTPAEAVTVKVTKPWAPIRGMVAGEIAVEIQRRRGDGVLG